MNNNKLIPPYKFFKLNNNLNRGSYPKPKNFNFLKRLKLTTIISLIPKEPVQYLKEWCLFNNIELIWFQVNKPKETIPLSFSKISQIIQTIVDRLNLSIYIHCLDGELVTGIVCASFRKLQCWSVNNCLFEFARVIGESSATDEEQNFIEKFTTQINLTKNQFEFLFPGQSFNFQHPNIKLNFIEFDKDYVGSSEAGSIKSNSSTQLNHLDNNSINGGSVSGASSGDQGKFKQSLAFLALALEGAETK